MAGAPLTQGDVLWTPTEDAREHSELAHYLAWLRRERSLDFADYDELWRWSVADLPGFWALDLGLLRDRGARAVRAGARVAATCRGPSGFPARD